MIIRKRFNILFLIGVFIILYQPPILPFNSIHLVGLISLAVLALKRGRLSIDFRKDDALLFFIYVALYILVFCILINRAAISAIAFPLYFIIDIIPFSLVTKDYMDKHSLGFEDLIWLFVTAGIIQGIIALLAFCFPSVQSFFIDKILNYGYAEYTVNKFSSFRIYGFSPYLTFAMPVIQTVLSVLCFFKSGKNKSFKIVIGILLFFSAIINARISVIVFIVGVIAYIISRDGETGKKIKNIFIFLLAVVAFLFVALPFIEESSPTTYEWLLQGVEELKVIFNPQTANSYSYYTYFTNKSTYRLPNTVFEFLFGSGSYVMASTNAYGVHSDVGYVNDVWFGGILYCILVYVGFFKIIKKLINSADGLISYIGGFFLILFPVLNLKGIAFTMFSLSNFLIIVYICTKSNSEKNMFNNI